MYFTHSGFKFKHIGIAITMLVFMGSQASAATFLTEKELLATIPGATIHGVSSKDNKTKWIQNYGKGKRKGKIAGLWAGKDQYKAEWYVKDGKWCEKWDGGEACWHVEQVKPNKLRAYDDGKPKKHLWIIK